MTEELVIRTKQPGDATAAAAIMLEVFRSKYIALCDGDGESMAKIAEDEMKWRGKKGNMFFAEYGGRPAGMIELISRDLTTVPDHVYMDIYIRHLGLAAGLRGLYLLSFLGRAIGPEECTVAQLGVLPEFRGRGVARALLGRALEFAVGTGDRTLALWVAEDNTPAIRLYESEGFKTVDRTESRHTGKFFGIPVWLKMARPLV